jgi:mRNA-degrading endonuclease toxin of MazEF toxin-antitoxin module
MSRYQRGDVVRAPLPYMDEDGIWRVKFRPFIVIDVDGINDNITVSCTGQTHQSKKFTGISVLLDSEEGRKMGIDRDSFIYCNTTVVFANKDIIRKIGTCPLMKEICEKLGYEYDED